MTAQAGPVLADGAQIDALRRLLQDAGLPVAGLDDAWRVWVVAESSEGTVVGGVALERHATDGRAAYLLRSLVVAPSSRGAGLGRVLVQTALDAARHPGGEHRPGSVSLLTETADSYFPAFGFALVPREDLPEILSTSAELAGACPDTARAFVLRDA